MIMFTKAACIFAVVVIATCVWILWNAGAFAGDVQHTLDWTPTAEKNEALLHDPVHQEALQSVLMRKEAIDLEFALGKQPSQIEITPAE